MSGDPVLADILMALDPVKVYQQAFDQEPFPWQVKYLRETRSTILLKGRQVGATQACAALAIHQVLLDPTALVAIVSPSLKQSTEICTRARQGLDRLGERLVQDSVSLLRLQSGGRILSLPGTAKSVRGWSAKMLILDEAAYVDEETWVASRALIATGGRLVIQSTPSGDIGPFYEAWHTPDPAWATLQVRSDEVPTISPEWLAGERLALTPGQYSQEYELSFLGASASLFDADRLRSLVLPDADPMWTRFDRAHE